MTEQEELVPVSRIALDELDALGMIERACQGDDID